MTLLVETVAQGSLSAAGRKLGVPLPTLSRKIAELEAHLGARMLVRSTRRLALTDAGQTYVAACKAILDQVAEAERAAAGEYSVPRGDLVLAAPVAFGRLHLVPLLAGFLARYPEVDAQLILSDRNMDLIDDHIDVALRIGRLPDAAMIATRVGQVRQVVCASPAFWNAHGVPRTPHDLSALPCVTHDFAAPTRSWAFAIPGSPRTIEVPVRPRLSVTLAEAAVAAAVAGTGVVKLLSYQVDAAVARGELQIALADHELAPLPVSLVHAAQGRLPQKTRSFLDHAAPQLRVALA